MAPRDPDTGQFVPADADDRIDDDWESFEKEWLRLDWRSEPGERSFGDGAIHVEPGYTMDPAGGLGRNEVAELVALVQLGCMFRVREEGSTGQTPGHVDGYVEISLSPDSRISHPDSSGDINKEITRDGYDGSGETAEPLDVEGQHVRSNDILHYQSGAGLSPFNDTVNGTGGGGDYHGFGNPEVINLRDEFGRGPILDRHNHIYFHGALQGIESPNQEWQMLSRWGFVWDVFDDE